MKAEINSDAQAAKPHPVRRWAQECLCERLADLKRVPDPRYDWGSDFTDGVTGLAGLVLANMSLPLEDEPQLAAALQAIYAALKPEGLFLGVMLGSESFPELRTSLIEAQVALYNGASPLLASLPKADDVARLIGSCGFVHPALDRDTISLTYPNLGALLGDFPKLGLTPLPLQRLLLDKTEELYRQRYIRQDGTIPVTLEVLFLHGWCT